MSATPTGRVALAPTDWRSRLLLSLVAVLPAFFLADVVFRGVTIFVEDLPVGLRLLVGVAGAAACFGLVIVVHAVRHPTPVADFDAGRLVVGTRSVPFAEIDEARHVVAQVKATSPSGVLRIGRSKSADVGAIQAILPIPIRGHSPGHDLRRAALLVVLEKSSIRMPSDPYDPKGRFSQYNFPEHLDKERAMALIEDGVD